MSQVLPAPTDLDARIASNLNQPEELERLYRADPARFSACLPDLVAAHPDALLLRAWQARLHHDGVSARTAWAWPEIRLVGLLALAAGTLANLPNFFPAIDIDAYVQRNVGFFVFPFLAVFFALKSRPPRRLLYFIGAAFVVGAVYINLLPRPEQSDTIQLACLYLPLLLWVFAGVAYAGGAFRSTVARLQYLRYNGELLAYTGMILISGGALTAITVALFSAIGIDEELYVPYLVGYGGAGAPLVAAMLTYARRFGGERISSVLARVFTPLVLGTLVVYLVAMAFAQKNPYTDRDFLLIINVVLVGVLALTIFSISESGVTPRRTFGDYTSAALIATALLLNAIVLSAILFRLASYGLTPNRIAVLGANLVIFANLIGVFYHYFRYLRGHSTLAPLEGWIARYLTVFAAWFAFMIFLYPFLFRLA